MKVDLVRVSDGTGAVLGLWRRKMDARPTTAYVMTYRDGGCRANCRFCLQAQSSRSDLEKLSRISWPKTDFEDFQEGLTGNEEDFERVCVQALNYPEVLEDLVEIVSRIRDFSEIPISVSCQPLDKKDAKSLDEAGIERLCIPLDAANPSVFDLVKGDSAGGPYEWERHLEALEYAGEIFDERVTTHLIVGLGEKESEMANRIQFLHDKNIRIGLFAFTPIEGSYLSGRDQPDIEVYRRIQIARYLIENDLSEVEKMSFEKGELTDFGLPDDELAKVVRSGEPFLTSGCPGCNRPFYNESPSGPIYNYPRNPSDEEIEKISRQLVFSI